MPSSLKSYRIKADKAWFNAIMGENPLCEVCYMPAQQAHHFFYKGQHGNLRYDLDNGIKLCQKCHFILHHHDPKMITDKIIARRGDKWYQALKKKAQIIERSYINKKYYLEIINKYK